MVGKLDCEEWKGKTCSWKWTSLETKMVLLAKSKTLYPLIPAGKPRKTHGMALGSNLVLWWLRVDTKHREPNNLRCEYGGEWWNKSS